MTLLDAQQAELLLSTTRAVRRRLDLDRAVKLEVVRDCLRLAMQAPTGGSIERTRWILVTDREQRRAVADLYREATTESFLLAEETAMSEVSRKAYSGAGHLASVLERVPVLVFPCIAAVPPAATTHAIAGLYGSIVPAVWSFQLALRSRGLGSAYTTAHLRLERRFAELLDIPDGVTQVAMLPVAHTLGTEFKPAARGAVEDITYAESWGQKVPGWIAAPSPERIS